MHFREIKALLRETHVYGVGSYRILAGSYLNTRIFCIIIGIHFIASSRHLYQKGSTINTMQSGTGIQELMAAETRASQIVAEARLGACSIVSVFALCFFVPHHYNLEHTYMDMVMVVPCIMMKVTHDCELNSLNSNTQNISTCYL